MDETKVIKGETRVKMPFIDSPQLGLQLVIEAFLQWTIGAVPRMDENKVEEKGDQVAQLFKMEIDNRLLRV